MVTSDPVAGSERGATVVVGEPVGALATVVVVPPPAFGVVGVVGDVEIVLFTEETRRPK